MRRSANVATPLTAATATAPPSCPPSGLVANASDTSFVAPGMTLPDASVIATCTAGAIAMPAVAVLGCEMNSTRAGALVTTLNAALVEPVSPDADAASV